MNTQELWERYQDWLYFNEDLGLYLDVSRMRFDEQSGGGTEAQIYPSV